MDEEMDDDERCSQTYQWKQESNKCQCTVELGCWCWGGEVGVGQGEGEAHVGQAEEQVEVKDVGAESIDALWREFKWENIWFEQVLNCKENKFRGWKNIGTTFGSALSFGILLSIFDVSSDFLTFWLFLKGDNYRKTVPSEDSLYVTGSFNCSKTGHVYSYQEKTSPVLSAERPTTCLPGSPWP